MKNKRTVFALLLVLAAKPALAQMPYFEGQIPITEDGAHYYSLSVPQAPQAYVPQDYATAEPYARDIDEDAMGAYYATDQEANRMSLEDL